MQQLMKKQLINCLNLYAVIMLREKPEMIQKFGMSDYLIVGEQRKSVLVA